MSDYFDDMRHENITTVALETCDGEENKRFWMNVLKPSKMEREVVDGIKFKIKMLEFLIAIMSVVSILISQFEYELEYYPRHYNPSCLNPDESNYRGMPVRITISIICFLMAVMTIYNSLLFYRQKKEEKKIISSPFIKSYYFKRMILEVFIILIHPIPYVDLCFTSRIMSETINYRMATFFYALMFLKLFTFLRIIAAYTKYSSNMSSRYCDLFGSEAGTVFALKAIQNDHPFIILIFNFCSVSVVLGILLRMFEILYPIQNNQMNYNFYTNGIWNIIVAMTTIGYGDFYPRTHIGRFIVVVSIIIGTLLISLTIVALNRMTSFENNELQAYIILSRLKVRRVLEKVYLKNLKIRLHIYILRKQKKIKALTQDVEYMKLIRELRAITDEKRGLKRMLIKDSFSNEEHKFLSLSDQIEQKIDFIGNNIKMIRSYKNKLKAQLTSQKKLMDNIVSSLKLFRNW